MSTVCRLQASRRNTLQLLSGAASTFCGVVAVNAWNVPCQTDVVLFDCLSCAES